MTLPQMGHAVCEARQYTIGGMKRKNVKIWMKKLSNARLSEDDQEEYDDLVEDLAELALE